MLNMSSFIKKGFLIITLITLILLPSILKNRSIYASTQTLLHWDFNILDFYEGWQLQNISNNRVQNGYMYGENTSGDPQMRLPGIALDASRYNTLKINLKNQTNSTMLQVFWTTSSAPAIIKGPKNVTISALDSSFNEYSINMTHNDWTGTISQIRIDPVNASGSFYVDYIKFTGTPAYESYGSIIDISTSSGGSVSSTYIQITGSATTAIVEEAIGYEVRHGSLDGTLVDSGVFNATTSWSFTARHLDEGDNYIRVYCRDIDRIEHEDNIVLNMSLSSEPSVRPRPVPAEVWWGGCAPLEQLYENPDDWAFVKKYADGFFMHHAAWRPTVKYSVNMTDEVLEGIGNQVTSSGLRAAFELATLTARYYGESVIEKWNFDTDANFENWNLANVTNAAVIDGDITGQPTSADPQMYITGLNINADEVKGLQIIMKNETGSTKFQIFYMNPGDSGFTTQKYFEYTSVHAIDNEYVQYDIKLTEQQGWQNTISALRIDPVNGTSYSGIFSIAQISLLKYGVVEDWGFNDDGNLDGWNLSNINNATVSESALTGEPATSDPYMWKDNLSFDAAQVKNIRIYLKNQTGSDAMRIYWRNPGDSGFSEGKSYLYKPVRPNDNTYVIYGGIIPNWTGKITHLRIDPVNGTSQGSFSIDKITLYGLGSLDQSNFSTDGNMDGWSLANITNSSVSNGYFYGEPASADSYMYITGQSLDPSLLEKIKIRIKNETSSDKFQIFWTNPGDQGFSTSKFYEYSGVSTYDSDYKTYTIYTDNFEGWNGTTINGLRIDPVNGTSQGSFSIDYIYLDMAFYTESVEGWAQKTFDGQIGAPGSNSGWEATIEKTGIAMSTYDCDWQHNMGSVVSLDPTLTHQEQLDKFIDDFQKPFWQIFKYYYPYTEQAIIQCPIFWKWEDYPIIAPNQQDRLNFDPLKVHKPDSILSSFLDKNVLVDDETVSYSFEMKEVLTEMKQMFSDIGKRLAFATDQPYTWAAEVSGAETGREKVLAYESWLHTNGLKHYLTCHSDRTYIDDDDWNQKFYNDSFNRVILHQKEGGRADRYHLESWYNHDNQWMPSEVTPETDNYTYTRLGKDVIKFIKGIKDVNGTLEELDLDITQVNNGCEVTITNNGDIKCMPALVAFESGSSDISIVWYDDEENDITELMNSEEGWVYTSLLATSESVTITGEYTVNQQSAQKEVKIEAFWNPQDPTGVVRDRVSWDISVVKAWEFTSDTDGWTAVNQISDFGWVSGGYVDGNITGNDPYMRSETDLGLNISNNKYIKAKMKNSTVGTTAAILFITNSDGVWNAAKSKIFTINANDSNYTEYTIDMSTVSDWTGTLKQLRLDPVNSATTTTGSFSIDYIRIQNTP